MTRIIAGASGGRRLAVPAGSSTRPTTDRVREALFSTITAWAGRSAAGVDGALAGLSFADLFAGSGAVGLEAASRGAAPVVLIERSRRTAALATRNARELELDATVVTAAVEVWARQTATHSYDVIFADPPYEVPTGNVEDLVSGVLASGWLAESGLVVVERSSRTTPLTWPAGLTPRRPRSYGETVLYLAESRWAER